MEIKLERHTYKITLENGLLDQIENRLKDYPNRKIAVVTDETVWGLYGQRMTHQLKGLEYEVTVLPPGESTKSFESLQKIFSAWIQKGITRKDLVLAFGGGVIGDLAGFAAATYLRGIDFIQVPTTLLAQLDSSIGGKVAVDLPEGKNLVGAFHHPLAVWMDPELLRTLTDTMFASGAAEAVKAAAIADVELFEFLEGISGRAAFQENIHKILKGALAVKQSVVEIDEKEHGPRKLLNFGHTLGHGLESYFHYNRWSHGEAVAIGMVHMTEASESKGLTEPGTAKRLKHLLTNLGLPIESDVSIEELIPWMIRDKKVGSGRIDLILLKQLGAGYIHSIPLKDLHDFLNLKESK